MNNLIDYLRRFGSLDAAQTEFILSKTRVFELRKGEFFCEADKITRLLGFLLEGAMRCFYYNQEGEEITNYFVDENTFVPNFEKFEAQLTAGDYIQAVTDVKLLVVSREGWEEITNRVAGWDLITARIGRNYMVEAFHRRSSLISVDATARYLSFIESFPTLAGRIPLAYVASYLGITQQSLSRIRRNTR